MRSHGAGAVDSGAVTVARLGCVYAIRLQGGPPAPNGAIEIAATTSHSPPARTRRPGGVRRPKHLRVRNGGNPEESTRGCSLPFDVP
jgi:hypothetical protein